MALRWGFKAEANRIAIEIRTKMNLAPTDPIDPVRVCERFDIPLLRLSELDCDASAFLHDRTSDFSAVTVPCRGLTAIVHNDSHHPYRQRSNICHELAHCFLGHSHAPPLTSAGELSRNGGIEAEANFLAGSLLIPNEAAIHIVLQELTAVAQQLYGVSQQMLNYRLRVSGAFKIRSRARAR